MDNATERSTPSTLESEQFWTEGQDALQSASGANPHTETPTSKLYTQRGPERRRNWRGSEIAQDFARVFDERGPGIDIPGVGHVVPSRIIPHPGDVGLLPGSPISPGCARREDAVDEVPQPRGSADGESLLKLERARLYVELLFASKALADAQLEPETEAEPAYCVECVAEALRADAIAHEENCTVGRVQRVIAKLCATAKLIDGRRFEIGKGPGDAWTLKLYEDGKEMGGGQFPADDYDVALEAGQSWCDVTAAEGGAL